jgi:hypothetical protein
LEFHPTSGENKISLGRREGGKGEKEGRKEEKWEGERKRGGRFGRG